MALAILAKIAFGAAAAGVTGGPSSSGGKGGTGAGTIAKGVLLSQALLGVAKSTWSTMKTISGQMKNSFNLLKKSFNLMLKPIADTIGLLLRPLALSLLRFAIPFYKSWLSSDLFKALMTPPEKRTEKQKAGVLTAEGATGAAGGAVAGAYIAGPPGALIGAMVGAILVWIDDAVKGFNNLMFVIKSWLDEFFSLFGFNMDTFREKLNGWIQGASSFSELFDYIIQVNGQFYADMVTWINDLVENLTGINMLEVGANIAKFFVVDIPKFWSDMVDSIRTTWNSVMEFFTVTVPGWILNGWESIKTFFAETVPSWFNMGWETIKGLIDLLPDWVNAGWEAVKTLFTDTIPNAFRSMADRIKSFVNSLNPFSKNKDRSRARGGVITETGPYNLHAGEMILRSGQVNEMKQSPTNNTFSPTINVSANINSDMDIRTLANRLSELMEIEYRRKVSY